jgi:8-oxo-dGTP pyrophosphatase MutT (NUDIX family)
MSNRDGLLHHLVVKVYKHLPRSVSSFCVRMLKKTWPIGVVVIVLDESNRLLMLEHRYHQPAWRLPGGLMDRGESPFETAAREAFEEAHCVVSPLAVIDAADSKYTFDIAVLARLEKQEIFHSNAEIRAYRWSEIQEVLPELNPVQQRFVQTALSLYCMERGDIRDE